jgi:hypothetical protein
MPEKEVNLPEIGDSKPKIPIQNSKVRKPLPKSIPKTKDPTNTPTLQQPIKKIKPAYKYIGKESLASQIRNAIPKQLIPTNRFTAILGIIFLLVIILSLIQFPFSKLLSGDVTVVIKIGYPMSFLELGSDYEKSPLQIPGLIVDLIIYLILTYIIDVTINLILSAHIFKSKEELMKKPKIYKNTDTTIADKVVKEVFKK